jgi:integrase
MIETVYKPKRRKNGKLIAGRMYRGRYRLDPRDKIRDVALRTTEKQVAEQKLRKIVQDEQREREGLIAPHYQREAATTALLIHIKNFIADRRSVRCDEKYVRELERKLIRLCSENRWLRASDISAESFCAWRARQRLNPKTLNEYLNAACGFLNWLEPRIGSNPLRHVQKAQTNGVKTLNRRAFTEAELQSLFAVSGPRGVVYRVAARTGIRRGELAQIEWPDVHLDTAQPFIHVRACVSKNHRAARQPLPPDAADALRELRLTQAASSVLVLEGRIPRMNQFRKDLDAANIPYTDSRGERADFHALRKTYGTMLTLAGVGQRTVMELMRHSDPRLTLKTYTDANMLPVSDAIVALTNFAASKKDSQIDSQELVPACPTLSATVPPNAGEPRLLTAGEETFSPSESASVRESLQEGENARCRVRTCDLSPRRPLGVLEQMRSCRACNF